MVNTKKKVIKKHVTVGLQVYYFLFLQQIGSIGLVVLYKFAYYFFFIFIPKILKTSHFLPIKIVKLQVSIMDHSHN